MRRSVPHSPSARPPSLLRGTRARTDALLRLGERLADLRARIALRRRRLSRRQVGGGSSSQCEPSLALERVRRGELPPRVWLAERLDVAVAPLAAVLDESTLAFVRAFLEERVAADPLLRELVRRLIGPALARYDRGGRLR